jgi:hypothetical protein
MARNIFSRQVWKLQQRGYSLADAKRIAYYQQVKNGNIQPGTYQLTDQWKEYSNLFSEKRAVIRKNRARQNQLAKKQQALEWILE